MKKIIKGITLHRPWAAGVSHFGKDIENRSWKCPLPIGSYLAIHSGSAWDEDGVEFIQRYSDNSFELQHYGSLLCHIQEHFKGAIVAIAQFNGNTESSDSVWYIDGSIGWQLINIVQIEPVWCKGQPGLWDLPDKVLHEVRNNYKESIAINSSKLVNIST